MTNLQRSWQTMDRLKESLEGTHWKAMITIHNTNRITSIEKLYEIIDNETDYFDDSDDPLMEIEEMLDTGYIELASDGIILWVC